LVLSQLNEDLIIKQKAINLLCINWLSFCLTSRVEILSTPVTKKLTEYVEKCVDIYRVWRGNSAQALNAV